jgi:hypothetical protein
MDALLVAVPLQVQTRQRRRGGLDWIDRHGSLLWFEHFSTARAANPCRLRSHNGGALPPAVKTGNRAGMTLKASRFRANGLDPL